MEISNYEKIRLTTDVVILTTEDKEAVNHRKVPEKGIQVLLIKRDEEPFNGMWTLPGGFVDSDKSISECVDSKLYQKTGLNGIYKEQLFTYGDDINRDPRDRVVTIAYLALVSKDKLDKRASDKQSAWFWVETDRLNDGTVSNVTFRSGETGETVTNLGFDHSKIICDSLNRIINKIMYTDIGFNLVADEFTIKDLQVAYETIVGKNIPGFRRIIESKIEETGKMTTDIKAKPDSFRPAKLFKKK